MKSLYSDIRWAKIQEPREGGVLEEYNYSNDNGSIRYRYIKKVAGNIDGKEYYDIASFRGTGGPIVEYVREGLENEFMKKFNEAFDKYCLEQNIIAEFAKIDPWSDYHKLVERECNAEYYGNFYCNDLTENFFEQTYNRNAKRAIKKAVNGGVEVLIDNKGDTIDDFVRLYQNTEIKYNTGDYYNFDRKDIKKYFDELGKDAFLIDAVLNGEIITSVLVVCGKDVMHYYLLGNNTLFLNLQCNSLLTYHAALYGQKIGKKVFDMGGGKAGGNIEIFKKNFCGQKGITKYFAIKKVRNEAIYNKLVTQKKEINNKHFFPHYRG